MQSPIRIWPEAALRNPFQFRITVMSDVLEPPTGIFGQHSESQSLPELARKHVMTEFVMDRHQIALSAFTECA